MQTLHHDLDLILESGGIIRFRGEKYSVRDEWGLKAILHPYFSPLYTEEICRDILKSGWKYCEGFSLAEIKTKPKQYFIAKPGNYIYYVTDNGTPGENDYAVLAFDEDNNSWHNLTNFRITDTRFYPINVKVNLEIEESCYVHHR